MCYASANYDTIHRVGRSGRDARAPGKRLGKPIKIAAHLSVCESQSPEKQKVRRTFSNDEVVNSKSFS